METLFCPIDEISGTNATVKCSDSAFPGSDCTFSCPTGYDLLGPGNGMDSCSCDGDVCEWDGLTRFGNCYQEKFLFANKDRKFQKNQEKIARLKFAGNELDPNFDPLKDRLEGIDEEFLDMTYEDLKDQFKVKIIYFNFKIIILSPNSHTYPNSHTHFLLFSEI